jgi:hypothetical protein
LTASPLLRRKELQKLQRRLKAGPKANDEPGFIYVYYLQHEAGQNYWKVGRTSRDPEKRHKEWQSAHHATHIVITKRTWKVSARAVKFVEGLIHLMLHYCRMYRYPEGDTGRILSVWASTGSPIRDADFLASTVAAAAAGGDGKKERLVARRKMIEWFWLPWSELEALITQVCDIYSPATTGAAARL